VFFLGFTMTDLGGRNSLSRYKGEYIVPGGTGNLPLPTKGEVAVRTVPSNTPITAYAADEASNPQPPPHADCLKAHGHADHGHAPAKPPVGFPLPENALKGSSSWQSRPVTGLTLPEFAPEGHDDHGDPHGSPDH